MARFLRILLRLVTLVLALSVVVMILTGGAWYMWQIATENAPEAHITITAQSLEKAALGAYLRYRGTDVTRPVAPDDGHEQAFVVDQGQSVTSVAYRLQAMGLIADAELFRRVVQYHGADGDIQYGVYTLRPNMTMEEIMGELQHGRLPTTLVTITEGMRIEEIAQAVEDAGITTADAFVQAARLPRNDFTFLRDMPSDTPWSLEGFLFPDTYQFPQQATPERLISMMLQNWNQRVPESLRDQAAAQDLTLYQTITLASIVEREAVLDSERALIAGVYLNRIQQGMYLQSDPTVQYAKGYSAETGKWWNPMIQEEAITVVSPYNSFLNPGLPPTPICNPGLASIAAALEPAKSEYLFFYAKGDGSHAFAVTYEEHLQNEQRYGGGE